MSGAARAEDHGGILGVLEQIFEGIALGICGSLGGAAILIVEGLWVVGAVLTIYCIAVLPLQIIGGILKFIGKLFGH